MRNAGLYGLCLALVGMVSGCASIVSGTNQPITVETRTQGNLLSGATCKLVNDKGVWYVTTPGSVLVHRSLADLKLSCEKDGSSPGLASIKSNTKAMAFGNAVFGGLIGVGVDVASGAAFDYPDLIQVEMVSTTAGTSPASASAAVAISPKPPVAPSPVMSTTEPPAVQMALAAETMKPNEAPERYPRTLSGPEIVTHFQHYTQLEMEQTNTSFLLKVHADGKVERDCSACKVQHGDGTLTVKPEESLACFNWYWVTYPASGCYHVLQTGKNEFSLDDPLDHMHYSYAVPK
jgi:hypothetical protein